MPVLRNHVPKVNKNLRVREVLADKFEEGYKLEVVESVSTVERLYEICQKPFHSFPVVNMAGKVIGMIPKNFIIVLIE